MLRLQDGFDHLSSSLLAHRIFAQIHLLEQDYPNAISVCNEGVALLSKLERRIGTPFPNSRLAFQTILATSYVHYYSPKHHPLAEPLLEEVLKSRPQDTMGLIGKGFVLEAKKEWQAAKEVFGRVEASVGKARQEEDAGFRDVRQRALEEKGWSTFMGGEQDEGREMLAEVLGELDAREMQNESTELTGARVSWKLGMCFWELAGGAFISH
jgi:superkiller protein 3